MTPSRHSAQHLSPKCQPVLCSHIHRTPAKTQGNSCQVTAFQPFQGGSPTCHTDLPNTDAGTGGESESRVSHDKESRGALPAHGSLPAEEERQRGLHLRKGSDQGDPVNPKHPGDRQSSPGVTAPQARQGASLGPFADKLTPVSNNKRAAWGTTGRAS